MLRNCQILSFCLTIYLSFFRIAAAFDHSEWDSALKLHVKDGLVQYAAWKHNLAPLNHYLEEIKSYPIQDFAKENREERMALWINVYNAAVIRKILEGYPNFQSINRIPNFWTEKFVTIAGMNYSLEEIRNQIIRKGFRDERATLALISGYVSAGPLRDEAYLGSKLSDQLKDQSNRFLTDLRYNRIKIGERKLRLSPLFKELSDDFILGYASAESDDQFNTKEMAILSFVRTHVQDPEIVRWLDKRKYKIRYLNNNWELNDYREKK